VPFAAKTPNAVPALAQPPVVLLMPDYSLKSRYRCDIAIDIGPALEKKLLACDAHATQFYEFTPWQAGFLHPMIRLALLSCWNPYHTRSFVRDLAEFPEARLVAVWDDDHERGTAL